MKFTIAICTWNGASRIESTLDSIVGLEKQDEIDWELLVVDNNSTDNTRQVCESFSDRIPIRVVEEKQQGLSFSRNCAVDHATGDYMIWTDDDVKVAPDWLAVYRDAIEQYPNAAFFGGKIKPFFQHKTPAWVNKNWEFCSGVFAERDLGDERFEINALDNLPFGANFVTRTDIQNEFRYDPKFGRVAKGVRGFDEIDVLSRMLAAGHVGIWIPEACLEHLIPESRTSLKYVADFYEGQGETWIERGVSKLEPNQIRSQLRRNRWKYFFWRLFSSRYWLPILAESSNLRGQLKAIQQSRETS